MLSIGVGPCRNFLFAEFHHHTCNSHLLCNCHFNGSASLKEKNLRRLIVKAARDYKRVPMETAGAYQLIDRQTGEKLIVWGGVDDEDDSLQQQKILVPLELQQQTEGDAINHHSTAANSKRTTFGRLKVAKIKSLIKSKSSKFAKVTATTSSDSEEEITVHDTESRNRKPNLNGSEGTGSGLLTQSESESESSPERVNYEQNRGSSRMVDSTMRGWSGATSPARTYTSVTRQPRKLVADSGFFSRKSFKQLGCTDDMIECLRSQSVLRPSHIQAISYAPVLKGKTCIIADQSGSGKTLAYLVPVVQRLRQEELQGLGKSLPRSPRVVILAPTAELASQVLANCRSISKHGVPFRSMVATGGFRQRTQLDSLQQELDVLIATPGRFLYLLQQGFVQVTNLKCVVLDEVDILFGDEEFEQVLQSLIDSVPLEAQYLFVTATLPVDIYNKLVQVFPDCEVTMGPGVHRTSTRLEEVLVDCSGDGMEKNPETAFLNKKTALLKLAEEFPVPKTIVFCNKIETCRKVENALNRFDRTGLRVRVLPFHAALAQDARLINIKEFLTSQSKDHMFLICTDRASRGIDFPNVDHVVLFDFPRDPSEYVRRVGRTARGAAGEGKAFVFVVGKQVSLARRIMERNKKGHPLHDVPCAYELESSPLTFC